MYSDHNPHRPDRDINGKKYKRWYDRTFAEQAFKKKKADEEKLRQMRAQNQHGTQESTPIIITGKGCIGRICVATIFAATCVAVALRDEIKDTWQNREFIWENLDELKKYYDEDDSKKRDSIQEAVQKRYREKKEAKRNSTSMLELEDNKTLILFPDHVVDQDNLLNPQWHLQLG